MLASPSIPIGALVGLVFVTGLRAESNEPLTYEREIRPILREHCFDCHGATEELKGELDLRLVWRMTKGGKSGPAIVPGKPGASFLLKRVRAGEMPPGKHRVPDAQISTLERWIAAGAPTARPEPETIGPGLGITPEERAYWAFQPIRRPDVPHLASFSGEARVRTPIDALLLNAMPPGSTFAPDASRFRLIRRAYLILIGLPPTPEEVERWLTAGEKDKDTEERGWFDRLITELLDSPHYGERWARHWLDVAGYADSEGYTVRDQLRPWAWKYRDWVIRALNEDKPLDQFIIEQLAGDELAGERKGDLKPHQVELLTATGFLRMAADGTGSGENHAAARNDVIKDTIKIVGESLLGLSLHCAQCHDHRYDPIPQSDYYALRAIFEPALDWRAWKPPQSRLISLYTDADRKQAAAVEEEARKVEAERNQKREAFISAELEKQLKRVKDATLHDPPRRAYRTPAKKRNAEQNQLLASYPFVRNLSAGSLYLYNKGAADKIKAYDKKVAAVRAKKPTEEFLRVLLEPPNHAPETKLFFRGDHEQPKQTVLPAALTVSAPENERQEFAANDASRPTTGRRLAFAKWLTSGRHPLLARVLVNRIWLHHFGRGIVNTPGDFGKLGTRPVHPELLDWLADELMRGGWSLKKLHRTIMKSTVWRQSSRYRPEITSSDNALLLEYGRRPILRLEAEAIRDRVLAASGRLDRKLFGAPIPVKETDTGQVVVAADAPRRSIYVQVRRSRPVALLEAFDAPVMETNCARRPTSTAPAQALMMLNGPFVLAQAAKLADRAVKEARPVPAEELGGPSPDLPGPKNTGEVLMGQVVRAFELVLGRRPEPDEVPHVVRFVTANWQLLASELSRVPKGRTIAQQVLTNVCHALLNSSEFLFVD